MLTTTMQFVSVSVPPLPLAVTSASLALLLLLLVLRLRIYLKFRHQAVPRFAPVERVKAGSGSTGATFDGKPVDQLNLLTFVLWNAGWVPMQGSDISESDPIRVKHSGRLLGAPFLLTSAEGAGLEVIDDHTIDVSFDSVGHNNGVCFQIFHAGTDEWPVTTGTLGRTVLNEIDADGENFSAIPWRHGVGCAGILGFPAVILLGAAGEVPLGDLSGIQGTLGWRFEIGACLAVIGVIVYRPYNKWSDLQKEKGGGGEQRALAT